MKITAVQLKAIASGRPVAANVNSMALALDKYGEDAGLDKPHRLAHFIAQVAHESGGFRYDRELWGPTPAQKRYEGRRDLGNTRAGDGKKFAGRGPIQLTGRGNVTRFRKWATDAELDPPDFVAAPEQINTDPWEGLSAIWFWATGNPRGKSLNAFADSNDIEMVSRTINGGLNGFDDRLRYYTRAALVILGYAPDDVKAFQRKAKLVADGISGPKTRAALHLALVAETPAHEMANVETRPAPVTTEVVVDVKSPGRGVADSATGAGLGGVAIGGVIKTAQETLTPYSVAGGWIETLVVVLVVLGVVVAIGGLAYRFWAGRQKAKTLTALNGSTK